MTEQARRSPRIRPESEASAASANIAAVCDPVLFLQGFRGSLSYAEAYSSFFQGKMLPSDATEEEKAQAFEKSGHAKLALIEYAEHEAHFEYRPQSCPNGASTALDLYAATVRDIRRGLRTNLTQDDIEERDRIRTQCHLAAASSLLTEGIVPNILMGRVLARLVLVSERLETYDDARAMA